MGPSALWDPAVVPLWDPAVPRVGPSALWDPAVVPPRLGGYSTSTYVSKRDDKPTAAHAGNVAL